MDQRDDSPDPLLAPGAGEPPEVEVAGASNSLPPATQVEEEPAETGWASSPADPPPWRSERDGDVPMIRLLFGPRVPDLTRIDRASWAVALAPFSEQLRTKAALAARVDGPGMELVWSFPPPASDAARREVRASPRFPSPSAAPLGDRRQVSVRLRGDEYESLATAARILGGNPTQIARILILNGVRRVLAEYDSAATSP